MIKKVRCLCAPGLSIVKKLSAQGHHPAADRAFIHSGLIFGKIVLKMYFPHLIPDLRTECSFRFKILFWFRRWCRPLLWRRTHLEFRLCLYRSRSSRLDRRPWSRHWFPHRAYVAVFTVAECKSGEQIMQQTSLSGKFIAGRRTLLCCR